MLGYTYLLQQFIFIIPVSQVVVDFHVYDEIVFGLCLSRAMYCSIAFKLIIVMIDGGHYGDMAVMQN